MLRPLEDALDCFAAVTMVKGAAERWSARNLKPSDAAKTWIETAGDSFLAGYRKTLRGRSRDTICTALMISAYGTCSSALALATLRQVSCLDPTNSIRAGT